MPTVTESSPLQIVVLDDYQQVIAGYADWKSLPDAELILYDTEPLPVDHPLRAARNTVLTPHLGYVTADTYHRFFTDAVEDITAWRSGSPVRRL